MQFIVTGLDGKDQGALDRRMAAREDHLAMAKTMADTGKWLYAAAILDDDGKMIGSVIICEFESKEELKAQWLDREPYVLGKVWERVEITRGQVPPLFSGAGTAG
ncbi:MAG: YciI family protein [Desulfobacterales bacterium]|nr:YciI family protein [Desulfobacterales bacterium]